MLRNTEKTAIAAGLRLLDRGSVWTCDGDWPHLAPFRYDLALPDGDVEELVAVGTIDGYRIAQDWTVESDLEIWDEADALDGDAVRYVEALIREMRVCEQLFEYAPGFNSVQRITLVGQVEARKEGSSVDLTQAAVASLAMMDAPVVMLVDAWPTADERQTPAGKLKGRSHIPKLMDIGFMRMVGSRFVWAWNRELSETTMANYSYDELLAAKRSGALDEVLGTPLSEAFYGPLPGGVAKMLDTPDPSDLEDE